MKTYARYLVMLCALSALGVAILLLAAPSAVGGSTTAILPPEQESQPGDTLSPNKPEAPTTVIFPPQPGPVYAQEEITLHPEPPIPGQPTEVCAWVVNTEAVSKTATLEFGVAEFGIGLPFHPIGVRRVEVPPTDKARACVVWIPREPKHWCIQVVIRQPNVPDKISQRNIDVWEDLRRGVPADTVFPVSSPTTDTLEMRALNIKPGWVVTITPQLVSLDAGQTKPVTLTVVAPLAVPLGSRTPIVDVEAWSNRGQGVLIGGFRKMDVPPVPLHRPKDPPYAETEIDVFPYPPLPGEPTKICAELRNLSGISQTVDVGFMVADFGIGQPWQGIGGQLWNIPRFGKIKACVTWIPPKPGQFCIRVNLDDPDQQYAHQESQRNLDVHEVLKPGLRDDFVFPVGNPTQLTTTVYLTIAQYIPGWEIFLSDYALPNMKPNETRPVTLSVRPGNDPMPEDGAAVVDVEAGFLDGQQQWMLIGGFRKIVRPPIPIHRPWEPPYSESEISVRPYPPRANEPVLICAELRNPTPFTPTVNVDFGVINFGIGLPFLPIDHQQVDLPPFSRTKVCTRWVPPREGHFCAQIIIRQPGFQDIVSQRNMDVAENLRPGIPDRYEFPIGNPFDKPITVTLGLVKHLADWQADLSFFDVFLDVGMSQTVVMTVTPPQSLVNVPDEEPVLDVEAYFRDDQHEWTLLGGFRKVFRPPVPIHRPEDPIYAESEISVDPYPPRANEPTNVCVELRNPTAVSQTIWVEFAWANFGIGLPWQPIQRVPVTLPPHSVIKQCVKWVPPFSGRFCIQVRLTDPDQRFRPQISQRNMDVGETFVPGQWTKPFAFQVGNPGEFTATIALTGFVHLKDWKAALLPPLLPDVPPHATRWVTLTVFVPQGPLPPDDTPVVDVEAHTVGRAEGNRFIGGDFIGGFRKIYRPPVPIHRPGDPIYAESEISINPYPPRAGEPTEICADVRNPTGEPQTIMVSFAVANFGIGLPFNDIASPLSVPVPTNGIRRVCVTWVPPAGGHFCAQVTLQMGNLRPVWSQRNMDVSEILRPGIPSVLRFAVGNFITEVATVTLGLVPHLEGWDVRLSQKELPNMQRGMTQTVILTVTPPLTGLAPLDGSPVVDVEGFIGGNLIGGFRKLFHPPMPIHRPKDPIYAESEIHINPYPPRANEPTEICVDVRNPTIEPQTVTVTFSVARFGIGLPFNNILRPITATLPSDSIKQVCVKWVPPEAGRFCAQVTLQIGNHDPVWSQRNMDVGEILLPGRPSDLSFPVRNPTTDTVTVTLGTVLHMEDWTVRLSQDTLPDVQPGATRWVTLTVTPPLSGSAPLDGDPVVDVEGFVGGNLIGGFRKVFHPPVPIHRPKDPVYAESEIFVDPYPTLPGLPTLLGAVVFNPTPVEQRITVTFEVANFGIGLPFTRTGIMTPTMALTIPPFGAARAKTIWIPPFGGHFCVRIWLRSAGHEPVWSQRNIDVGEPLHLGDPHARRFVIGNPMTEDVTITLALVNHRPGWTTELSPTVLANMQPGMTRTVVLTVTPPLPATDPDERERQRAGLADEKPIVDVEAYVDGVLIGGIRKIAKPPIPLHKPQDRTYAETEINVTPYPLVKDNPSTITTDIVNTGETIQVVRVLFGVANFGFGIPFTTTGIMTTSTVVTLSPGMSQTVSTVWTPRETGNWCIQVRLQDPDNQYPEQKSQKNVHVERQSFKPCEPFTKEFWLENSTPFTVTVTIGASAINLPEGWTYSTAPTETVLGGYDGITVTVTITPPCQIAAQALLSPLAMMDTGGASGPPTIDVEGYDEKGELMGGIQIQLESITEYKLYLPIVLKQ